MHELAEVEVRLGHVLDRAIDTADDRHGCVELPEPTHRPVLALRLVVPADAGRLKELRSDPLLALTVLALVAAVAPDLPVGLPGCQHALSVSGADAI